MLPECCGFTGHADSDNADPAALVSTQNIFILFIQRRTSIFDVGPTLYKYYTNLFVFTGHRIFYFSVNVVYIYVNIPYLHVDK